MGLFFPKTWSYIVIFFLFICIFACFFFFVYKRMHLGAYYMAETLQSAKLWSVIFFLI